MTYYGIELRERHRNKTSLGEWSKQVLKDYKEKPYFLMSDEDVHLSLKQEIEDLKERVNKLETEKDPLKYNQQSGCEEINKGLING